MQQRRRDVAGTAIALICVLFLLSKHIQHARIHTVIVALAWWLLTQERLPSPDSEWLRTGGLRIYLA